MTRPPLRLFLAIVASAALLALAWSLLAGSWSPAKTAPAANRGTVAARTVMELNEVAATPSPDNLGLPAASGGLGTALIGGYATYYSDPARRIDHYAAAGKLLREALGDWRGKVIRVQSGKHSTIVALLDSCACGNRHGLPTLLDLSPAAFRDLAPLSAGVIRVSIEVVALPSTDALPRNAADLRLMDEVRGDELYRTEDTWTP